MANRFHRCVFAAALTVAVPTIAAAQLAPAAPSGPVVAPAMPLNLSCQLTPRAFGPGVARVTNVGTATAPLGRVVNVVAIQAASSGASYVLSAPLPPGGSVDIPLTGSSTLARGCVAN